MDNPESKKIEKSSDSHGIKTRRSDLQPVSSAQEIEELSNILNVRIDDGQNEKQKTNKKSI